MAQPKYKNLEHSGQTGSKSVTVCRLNSHAQSHTPTQTITQKKLHWIALLNCSIRSTVLATYGAHSSSFSCATCWHNCQLTEKKGTLAEILFPLGPETVPDRQYCRSQRSRRKAWRHYRASQRIHGPVNCNNQKIFFFFDRGLTIMVRDPIEPD